MPPSHHPPAAAGAAPSGAVQEDALAGPVLGHQVGQGQALGGAVLGMGVVVVEARAVAEDQVGLEVLQGDLPGPVLLQVLGLVAVVQQLVDLEAAHVPARVLQAVVPARDEVLPQVAADQLHRLDDDVEVVHAVDLDAVLGLQAEHADRARQMTLPEGPGGRGRSGTADRGFTRTTFSGS